MNKKVSSFFLAHGEAWEVVASRAVSTLVKKILQEEGNTKHEAQENGTFELHYTPSDAKSKSYKVPLPKQQKSSNQINGYPINDVDQDSMTSKF
jgi:hypothetical protein